MITDLTRFKIQYCFILNISLETTIFKEIVSNFQRKKRKMNNFISKKVIKIIVIYFLFT